MNRVFLLVFAVIWTQNTVQAEQTKRYADAISQMADLVADNYVSEEIATQMVRYLRSRAVDDNFLSQSQDEISDALTADLRELSNDKHMTVVPWFDIDASWNTDANAEDAVASYSARFTNQGVAEVRVLSGNIGYLKLDGFYDPSRSGPTVEAAFKVLENSDALILDLRENTGGAAEAVGMIASYFLPENTLLNRRYYRRTGHTEDFYSDENKSNISMLGLPVAVLTSSNTASAAEAISYILKHNGVATIIGEVTSGGGHTADIFEVGNQKFLIMISIGSIINPITGTNWQGTGVIPDIPRTCGNLINAARHHLLRTLINETQDVGLKNIRNKALNLLDTAELNEAECQP